jgi:hypothetical protein
LIGFPIISIHGKRGVIGRNKKRKHVSETCFVRAFADNGNRERSTTCIVNASHDVNRESFRLYVSEVFPTTCTGKELSEAPTSGECTSGSRYGRVYRQSIADIGRRKQVRRCTSARPCRQVYIGKTVSGKGYRQRVVGSPDVGRVYVGKPVW